MTTTHRGTVAEALHLLHPERVLCNCRQAYAGEDGACAYGCSANAIAAKGELAAAYVSLRTKSE